MPSFRTIREPVTPERRETLLGELTDKLDLQKAKKTEAKDVAATWRQDLKELQEEIDELVSAAKSGTLSREVEVYDRYFPEDNIVKTFRRDTDEATGEERQPTMLERQLPVPFGEESVPIEWPDGALYSRGDLVKLRDGAVDQAPLQVVGVVLDAGADPERRWLYTVCTYGEDDAGTREAYAPELYAAMPDAADPDEDEDDLDFGDNDDEVDAAAEEEAEPVKPKRGRPRKVANA